MKFVFVHYGQESLGIEYLSTVLKERGFDVGLAYQRLSMGDTASPESVAQEILEEKPDFIGFCVFTETLGICNETAQIVREKTPHVPIIYGGIHASICPEETAAIPHVDIAFHGEALSSLPEWLECHISGQDCSQLKGIAFRRDDGSIQVNPKSPFVLDPDKIPKADKVLFARRHPDILRNYVIMTGFGCPMKCSYCEHDVFADFDGKVRIRMRSVESVIDEILFWKDKISYVYFSDEIFGMNIKWLEKFSDQYREKINKPFFANMHPKGVNHKRLDLLKHAGCEVINMGVQTASDRVRYEIYGRRETNEDLLAAGNLIKNKGLSLQVDRILGNPLETKEELSDAILLFKALHPRRVTTYWLTLYPNLPLHRIFEQAGVKLERKDLTTRKDGSVSYGMLVPSDVSTEEWMPYALLHVISPVIPYAVLKKILPFVDFIPKWRFLFYILNLIVGLLNKDVPILMHVYRTIHSRISCFLTIFRGKISSNVWRHSR